MVNDVRLACVYIEKQWESSLVEWKNALYVSGPLLFPVNIAYDEEVRAMDIPVTKCPILSRANKWRWTDPEMLSLVWNFLWAELDKLHKTGAVTRMEVRFRVILFKNR